jgi:hypothetical protein
MPRKDLNTAAFAIVQQATGETPPLTARQLAGKKGGLKGGKTRMESLTKEQRSRLAKDAARKRWEIAAPVIATSAANGRLAKQR